MCLDLRRVLIWGVTLLYIPQILFFGGWFKFSYAVLFVGVTCFTYFVLCKMINVIFGTHCKLRIPAGMIIYYMLIGALIIWVSGIGGFFPQSGDHIVRDVMSRELLYCDWPVVYETTGYALNYYFGFWLFPAFIGKCFLAMGITGAALEKIVDIVLFLWSVMHLLITFLLMLIWINRKMGKASFKSIVFVPIVFGVFRGVFFRLLFDKTVWG